MGLNSRHAAALWAQGQYDALYAYGKPFEVALLEWLPLEPGVVEVGATFTVQSDPVLAERCRAALRRHPNVVHLVASQDPAENERVLWARFLERRDGKAPEEPEQSLWRQSLNQSIAAQAATHTVYTGDRAPEDIAEVIHRAVVTPYGVASRVI